MKFWCILHPADAIRPVFMRVFAILGGAPEGTFFASKNFFFLLSDQAFAEIQMKMYRIQVWQKERNNTQKE